MFTLYVLYSALIDRYYIGFTGDDVESRLKKHVANHRGFTGKQADWKIVYTEIYDNKHSAMKREREIKSWKSRIMIQKLINSTE